MPNDSVLELSSLPERHPRVGDYLLHGFGVPVIIRLSMDPTPPALPADTMTREVTVDWITHPGTSPAVRVKREVGWSGLPAATDVLCVQARRTVPAHTLTEQAAVGVMALLIHDLEGGVLQDVLEIGSGGDYLVLVKQAKDPIQVEVSGIREDLNGSASRSRVSQKSEQVLTHSTVGYASVTTFSHPAGSIVHSYLHCVRRPQTAKKGRKKRK